MCATSARCLNGCRPGGPSGVAEEELAELDAEREIRINLWKQKRLLMPLAPHLPMRVWWERFLLLLMWYTGVTVPLMAAFQIPYHHAQLVIDYMVDGCFWVEIFMIMRTTYYDRNNDLVTDSNLIRNAYMYGRMPFDVIANFPWELFAIAAGEAVESTAFNSWRLIRMFRFCRIKKVHKPVLIDVNDSGARRLVLYFPLMTHWTACVWWAVGYGEYTEGYITRPAYMGGSSWLVRTPGSPAMDTASQRLGPLGESTLGQDYMSSLYWASTTLMKAAWIHPATISEKCFGAFVVLLGAVMFAVVLGQVNGIIRRIDESTVQRRNKIGTFTQFCQLNNVGPVLTKKIITYAMAEWNVTSGVSASGAFTAAKLPPILKNSLLSEMYKELLASSALMIRVSPGCAKQLLMKASTQVCLKNETLVGYGQMARELFVLLKGSLQISVPADVRAKSSKNLGAGDDQSSRRSMSKKPNMSFRIVDRLGAITGCWKPADNAISYPYEVVAKEFCTMLNISRVGLLEVINNVASIDRQEIAEFLNDEHEVTMAALKVGGKRLAAQTSRTSKASSRNSDIEPDPPEEEEIKPSSYAIAKEKFEVLGNTLSGVGASLSALKRSSEELREIFEAVSGTTTARSDGESARGEAGPSSTDVKDAAQLRAKEREEIIAKKKQQQHLDSNEEKQQITKEAQNQGANLNAAMVL